MGTRTSKGSPWKTVMYRRGKHIVRVDVDREVAQKLFMLRRERCITVPELIEEILGQLTITLEGANDGGDRAAA